MKVCLIGLFFVALIVLVIFIAVGGRNEYEDYINDSAQSEIIEWKPSGLDLSVVVATNKEILDVYGFNYSGWNEKDFYNEDEFWSATMVNNEGIPYVIKIDRGFTVYIEPLVSGSVEGY